MNGLLLVNKPVGMTSHDVINQIRKITKEKKVGHTGTLDPNASGLLIICIGEATKLIPYIDSSNKIYEAKLQFGSKTTTDDIEGEIIETKDTDNLKLADFKTNLKNFIGTIEQVPPIYSAKKVNGRKLYDYARKNIDIEIKPSKIKINNIEILDSSDFPNTITLKIDCRKGTYIRSLARDIAESLNNFAHLIELKRIETDNYNIKNSFTLDELKNLNNIEDVLIPIEKALKLPRLNIKSESERFLMNGNQLFNHNIIENINEIKDGEIVLLYFNNKLKGIGEKRFLKEGYIQPKKLIKT